MGLGFEVVLQKLLGVGSFLLESVRILDCEFTVRDRTPELRIYLNKFRLFLEYSIPDDDTRGKMSICLTPYLFNSLDGFSCGGYSPKLMSVSDLSW